MIDVLTIIATVGTGLTAGLLFAFSNFVMTALERQPVESRIATMKDVNLTIVNPLFLLVYVGTAAIAIAVGVGTIAEWDDTSSPLRLTGAVLYLAGVIGVTAGFNIPLNDRLAETDASPENGLTWEAYRASWMRWNHLRTVAATIACALFAVAVGS